MTYYAQTEDYPGDDAPTGERHWLADSGYDYDAESEIWTKRLPDERGIVARKSHKGRQWRTDYPGRYSFATTINPGDTYDRFKWVEIDDRTGSRFIITKKYLSKRADA